MTINAIMALLVEELTEGEIPMPLAQEFTLANIWADLARLAGESVPRDVAAVLDAPIGFVPVAGASFGQPDDLPIYAD